MSAPSTADYLKYANLQMAAEAFLVDIDANGNATIKNDIPKALTAGNLHASKFTESEATKFAAEWQVVAQRPNSTTGFSGTLFRNNTTRELVLSFRSTEFVDDAIRDSASTGALEIFNTGWAFGQLSDMEKWYAELKNSGAIPADARLNVTGYSLGGHLATAFNLLHQGEFNGGQVVTFNGAGVGRVNAGQTLQSVLAYFTTLRANPEALKAALNLSDRLAPLYEQIRQNLANGTWTAVQARRALNADYAGPGTDVDLTPPALPADAARIRSALDDIITLQKEADRIRNFTSGGTNDTALKVVPATEILAQTLDYRLAVYLASQRTESVLSVLNKTPGGPPLTNQWDLVGKETTTTPWSAVANSGVHYGANVDLFIEDQPLTRGSFVSNVIRGLTGFELNLLQDRFALNNFADTHSLVLIVDSLAIQNTLLDLIPEAQRTTATDTLTAILKNASWRKADSVLGAQGQAEGDVLENVVNALADLMLGPQLKANQLSGSPDGNTWWSTTNLSNDTYTGRDTFYEKLQAITASTAYKALVDKLTLTPITANLSAAGRTDFGAFAALYSLSPFQLSATGDILKNAVATAWGETYTAWTEDQATLADPARPQDINITTEWLADRASFLERKTWFNASNLQPFDPGYVYNSTANAYQNDDVYYWDIASDYRMAQGMVGDATRRFYFGDDEANTITGRGVADHLYGGKGSDSLAGKYGNDYLEGNAGSDLLDGGESEDTLVGGKDADLLIGGTDNDTVNGGQGLDTYVWTSGDGNDTLIDSDKKGRILINGSSLKLLVKDGNAWKSPDGKVTLSQADTWKLAIDGGGSIDLGTSFTDGDYGIYRIEVATGGTELNGDLAPKDDDPVTDGLQLGYDSLGNLKVTTADDPGRNDKLYGSGNADTIRALAGDDVVEAGGGNDLVDGGSGSDIVRGQGDHDTVWGDAAFTDATPLATALARGDTDSGQTERGDWVDGGAGNDILVGAAAQDLLTGGTENDLLMGGAGDAANPVIAVSYFVAPLAICSPALNNPKTVMGNQGFKSRRWRHGDSLPTAGNQNIWRTAA